MENEQTKIENILHVFDLINDNVINAKIGKKVAAIIAETGETAEHVIKTVGLKQCMPDDEDVLSIILKFPDLCQDAKNGSDDALRLIPPRIMSLEDCLEFIADDELLEITPKKIAERTPHLVQGLSRRP